MKFFNKKEIKMVASILFVISFISFFNFRISIRRGRDAQRKNDLGSLQDALERFHNEMGTYPLSENGKILACRGENTYYDKVTKTWINLRSCDWGYDNLFDYSIDDGTIFIKPIPNDPKHIEGTNFMYLSSGSRYQLLASLEGEDEAEYDPLIKKRNINCGNKICNYGKGSGSTPLDKSIDEYENELLEL